MKIRMLLVFIYLGFVCSVVQGATDEERLELADNYYEKMAQFYQKGYIYKSLPLAEKILKIRTGILGEEHPDTIQILNDLADHYSQLAIHSSKQGLLYKGLLSQIAEINREQSFISALDFFKKAFQIRSKILGEKHRKTLYSLTGLLLTHMDLENFYEALSLYKKGYPLIREVYGEKHQVTITAMGNLALIYHNLKRFSNALTLYEKSYSLTKEVLGEKHSTSLNILNNFAILQQDLGNFSEALSLSEKSYLLRKEVLGKKHPDTLVSLNTLTLSYKELGRLSEVQFMLEKGCFFMVDVLGEKHTETLSCLDNLVSLYLNLDIQPKPLNSLAFKTVPLTSFQQEQLKLAKTYNNKNLQYYQQGFFKKGLPFAKKTFQIKSQILGEKHHDTLIAKNNLGLVYMQLHRLYEALPLLGSVYFSRKNLLGEKDNFTISAMIDFLSVFNQLSYLFKFEAISLNEKAYYLSMEHLGEKHSTTIKSMNNLAYFYQQLGYLSKALLLNEKSYSLSQNILGEEHFYTLTSLNNLALLYRKFGRFSEALYFLEKCYLLRKKILGKKHPYTLTSASNLVLAYQDIGDFSKALSLAKENYSLRHDLLGANHRDTIKSLNNIAKVYKNSGSFSKARDYFMEVHNQWAKTLGKRHPYSIAALNDLAFVSENIKIKIHPSILSMYKDRKDLLENYYKERRRDRITISQVLAWYEESYSLGVKVLGKKHPDVLIYLNNLAQAYVVKGILNKGIQYLEKLVKGVEHLRSGNLSVENRQALFKEWVPAYFTLSNLYIKYKPVDAFHLSELSKSRTLLESLVAKRAAQESGLSKTEQNKLQDYQARLAFFNNKIAQALQENRIDNRVRLETDKNQLLTKLNQFHNELMAKYPKYAQLSKVQIISAKDGAKLLPKNAVLISYLVNKNNVLAFTLQNNGKLTAHDLGEIPELEKYIENYRRYLSFVENQNRSSSLRFEKTPLEKRKALNNKLAKHLLEPLKDIIKDKSHWIISPSGVLATLPFETLRLEGSDKPVIAEHQISYVQSLSVFAMLKKRDKAYKSLDNRGSLFAMGAPIYENTTVAQTNPSETDYNIARQLVMRGGDYVRALRQLNMNWQTLPGSLMELEKLKQLFKETKPRIYIQADATEAKLQSLNQQGILAKYRYLVFSAHGYLSPQVPALSSIVLGQVNNPEGTDGYITAGEWPGYDLKSDLMVLSACQTGLGKVISGEGVMGLPYAFYVAGNKNTILTLWSISDEVTVEFITSFFRKLKETNMGQIEALTATKREFIEKGGKYANPAYWAAFVLYGV